MSGLVIVGVDPGGAESGIVTRLGNRLLGFQVIRRNRRPLRGFDGYLREVIKAAGSGVPDNLVDWDDPGCGLTSGDLCWPAVAVEDVIEPSPHVRVTNVRGLLDTAVVVGAILAAQPEAIVVPPGHHGSAPFLAYPPQLRPTRGQGRGHDRLRHCRSGWDIAGAAATMLRIQQQGRPA